MYETCQLVPEGETSKTNRQRALDDVAEFAAWAERTQPEPGTPEARKRVVGWPKASSNESIRHVLSEARGQLGLNGRIEINAPACRDTRGYWIVSLTWLG